MIVSIRESASRSALIASTRVLISPTRLTSLAACSCGAMRRLCSSNTRSAFSDAVSSRRVESTWRRSSRHGGRVFGALGRRGVGDVVGDDAAGRPAGERAIGILECDFYQSRPALLSRDDEALVEQLVHLVARQELDDDLVRAAARRAGESVISQPATRTGTPSVEVCGSPGRSSWPPACGAVASAAPGGER